MFQPYILKCFKCLLFVFSHDEGFEEEEGKVSLLPHNSRNISAISYFSHNHDEGNGSLKVGCLLKISIYIC